jgi:hypothetical protein
MYTSVHRSPVSYAHLFRWAARAGAIIVVVAWLALVLMEAVRSRFEQPSVDTYYQAASLAIVFAGYLIGWWKEPTGGVIAILGTMSFFAVHALTLGMLPGLAAAWFAAPGVLYLLAWQAEHLGGRQRTRSP